MLGSVLAPTADFRGTSGVVLGTVVVGSFTSPSNAMQINNYSFAGALPSSDVPEPSTFGLLLTGFAALGAWKRRSAG